MKGVFDGYVTIVCVIGVGVLLAHLKVIDAAGQRTLQTLAYFVASPALLVVVLAGADLGSVFSGSLVATSAAVMATCLLYVGTALLRRQRLGDSVIGALCAVYVNAVTTARRCWHAMRSSSAPCCRRRPSASSPGCSSDAKKSSRPNLRQTLRD
jgi:predicted permease